MKNTQIYYKTIQIRQPNKEFKLLGKNDKCSQFAKSFTGNVAVISQLGRKVKRKTQGKELHANTTIMIGRLVSCST